MNFYLMIENLNEELIELSPTDRWTRFVEPLIKALAAEKLGKVLALSLGSRIGGRWMVVDDKITISVADLERGTALVNRIKEAAFQSM
jgi:hypothetical protein